LLIALGVVAVAVVVFGRALSERVAAPSEPAASSTVAPSPSPAPQAPATTPPAPSQPLDRAMPVETAPVVASEPPAVLDDVAAGSVTELVVTTVPAGARVTVNGVGWGTSPVTIRYLPPGEKRIRVSLEGYVATERVISVTGGQRQALDVPLDATP